MPSKVGGMKVIKEQCMPDAERLHQSDSSEHYNLFVCKHRYASP